MFGHDADPNSRNYRYGILAPTENADVVEDQFRRAHAYRNQLVEIERARRDRGAAAIEEAFPTVGHLAVNLRTKEETFETALKAARAARAGGGTVSDDVLVAYKMAKKDLEEARKKHKHARVEAQKTTEAVALWAEVNREANNRVKKARAECGLYWGTYLLVERSVPRSGRPPRFNRWRGDGQLGVQIQGGLPTDDVWAPNTRAYLEPINSRDSALLFRVGSKGRSPILARFPARLHRPFPDGSVVKWVYVQRRKIAAHYRWYVVFVLARVPETREHASNGLVAVNCGWRQLDDGVRVAYARDENGVEKQLVVPSYELSRWDRADGLRSTRDKLFNEARSRLAAWLKANDHPGWLMDRCAALYAWRSCARLASVAIEWRVNRFAGDEEIFEALEAWRKQDKHLWEWEANQRRKAVAWRDDLYRNWANDLAKQYRIVVPGIVDYSVLAERAEPDEEDESTRQSRGNRFDAAPGRLVQFLKERFAEVVDIPSYDVTQTCSECGHPDPFDAAKQLVRTCALCHETVDQDSRACRNYISATTSRAAT